MRRAFRLRSGPLSRLAKASGSTSVLSGGRSIHNTTPVASATKINNLDRKGLLFDKILVANRGEIACRVISTAKALGIRTVAVYSDADANSQFVSMADEAYRIGNSPSNESYLVQEKILEVCRLSGAQAVHPGYGFLSENESFSRACKAQGIVFIGPPESAIIEMGSKARSKEIMMAAGVPVTPGYWGQDIDLATLTREAETVGYPLMMKAVKGGGGKGMRIVRNAAELGPSLESCQREARASFGSSAVLIERYIATPRHIEFQIFADTHGNAVHIWERDCSVQRRHQKVLEEAPAPFLDPEVRRQMGQAAVNAALAVGYVGAGTVEFMLDTTDNKFYFMEMNTRLQVEHPVTEMVSGFDLVEWQIKIAAGQPLPVTKQEEIDGRVSQGGHAIEARVYAENPESGFLPASGQLAFLSSPSGGEFAFKTTPSSFFGTTSNSSTPSSSSNIIRVDTGIRELDSVTVFYDPMISKLIVRASNRSEALKLMRKALADYKMVGFPNNLSFLDKVLSHPKFVAGGVDTSFLTHHLDECLPVPETSAPLEAVAMAALVHAVPLFQAPYPKPSGEYTHFGAALKCSQQVANIWAINSGPISLTLGDYRVRIAPAGSTRIGTAPQNTPVFSLRVTRVISAADPAKKQAEKVEEFPEFFVAADLQPVHKPSTSIPGFENATSALTVEGSGAVRQGQKVKGYDLRAQFLGEQERILKATVVVFRDSGMEETYVWPLSSLLPGAAEKVGVEMFKFARNISAFSVNSGSSGGRSISTPMPGKIVKNVVKAGQEVKVGDPLIVMEAMKMEHSIKSTRDGVVENVFFQEGEFVAVGKVLISFKE